jgi:hypothetical protein
MDTVSTILELAGFALIVAAAFVVAVPLGLAVAGVSCVAIGYLLGRSS